MEQEGKTAKEQRFEAWYEFLQNNHPFDLEVKSRSPTSARPFCTISIFPWNKTSINTLWNGDFASEPSKVRQWEQIYKKWSGVVAVGGGSKLRLFLSRPGQQYLPISTIEVPDVHFAYDTKERSEDEVASVAWCMVHNADGFWPLIAFSANSILYLYSVETATYHGVLKGHGGKITSLAVHSVEPYLLASSSYDYTCRIYDLTEKVECKIDNPHWPGKTKMALGGAPFGLRSNEPEGCDYGRCTAILAGGPSGGHLAPVLGVAFHSSYPIIATCGMDRAVKIWRLPATNGIRISREDKPLFSSTTIHDAQVLSIHWLSKDILLSNCGEVIARSDGASKDSNPASFVREPSTLVLWKWLGLERFFPPNRETYPALLRGCASDYQESPSYKVISRYNLPRLATNRQLSSRTFVFESPEHTPLIALPAYGCVHLSSVQHFKPRLPRYLHKALKPRKDLDAENSGITSASDLVAATSKLDLNSDDNEIASRRLIVGNEEPPCWTVETLEGSKNRRSSGNDSDKDVKESLPKLEACAIAEDGRLLIAVGENEGIWIWRIHHDKQVRRVPVSGERQ